MPSLVRRAGSPYWFAAFDVPQPDGSIRRLKKSTKKRKRSEAMAEALRLEELERRGNVSDPVAASKAYQILAEAAESAAKGELSEARARELLARICEVSTGEALKFYTVRSWSEDWLAAKAAKAKPATRARYEASIKAFLGWMKDRADARLEAVTKADIRGFRDFILKGQGFARSARTANFYAADVASMFRAAVREGLLLASPAAALEKLPEDDSTEREVFTMAEVSKLVEAAGATGWQASLFSTRAADAELQRQRSEDWQGMILLGFYSGARIGDCARLTWANLDLKRGLLVFIPGKTSRRRKRLEVPLHPRLAEYLRGRKEPDDREEPLFSSLAGVSVSGKRGLSGHFAAIMTAAGVDRRTVRAAVKDKAGQVIRRSQQAKTFHSLRHSLTSTLANLDVSEEIRRRIVGHESAEVHAKYTHHERETLARALEKIPSI